MSAGQQIASPSRRSKRGQGRAQILKAAAKEFAANGYDGATTAGIARAAGVTQPLIHHHFSSKRRLWEATLESVYTDYKHLLARADSQTQSAPLLARMKARLSAFVRFSASRPESARMIMMEASLGGEYFDYIYKNYLEPELKALQALLKEGREKGVLRAIDDDLAPFLVIGAVIHPFIGPESVHRLTGADPYDEDTAERYAKIVADILIGGMQAKAD